MSYVDGYVLPVPKDKLDAYRRMAETARTVWLEHGALDYKECVADDVNIEHFVHFPEIIGAGAGEVAVFAYIVFNSREHRDAVNAKVMADPRLKESMNEDAMPFDCKRMAYGEFKTIVGD